MNPARFSELARAYSNLRIALIGDYCLDRYLEIDPSLKETSIETGLPVHNVVGVRAQPGAAGTILNNFVALGIGEILPVGFCGDDGEGFELRRALTALPGVNTDLFITTGCRRTFTYCKPLVIGSGTPVELNRLDSKNWTTTPGPLEAALIANLRAAANQADAIVVLDQVDMANTGVVTDGLLEVLGEIQRSKPSRLVLADSRRGLSHFPKVTFKMNAAELASLSGARPPMSLPQITEAAKHLAKTNGHRVFVSLSEMGILGATPEGQTEHVPVLPLRGPIDVVGAGDAVSANLTATLAAGADLKEALVVANAAASVVVHKLGTTGTATVQEILALISGETEDRRRKA